MSEQNTEKFDQFLTRILEHKQLWLLQANNGMFAMLEDATSKAYLPVWPTEADALEAANDNWDGYKAEPMSLTEFKAWLPELSGDGVFVGIHPDQNTKILALDPEAMRSMLE